MHSKENPSSYDGQTIPIIKTHNESLGDIPFSDTSTELEPFRRSTENIIPPGENNLPYPIIGKKKRRNKLLIALIVDVIFLIFICVNFIIVVDGLGSYFGFGYRVFYSDWNNQECVYLGINW